MSLKVIEPRPKVLLWHLSLKKNLVAVCQNYFLFSPLGGTVVPNKAKGKLGNNCVSQNQKLLYICFKYCNISNLEFTKLRFGNGQTEVDIEAFAKVRSF